MLSIVWKTPRLGLDDTNQREIKRSPCVLCSDQEFLAWVNDLVWAYIVEAAELVNRGAVLLGDPIESVPEMDLVVAFFGQRKWFSLDS